MNKNNSYEHPNNWAPIFSKPKEFKTSNPGKCLSASASPTTRKTAILNDRGY